MSEEIKGEIQKINGINYYCFNFENYTKLMNGTNKLLKKDKEEIERLHSIIKEVREYIEHENFKRNILVDVSTKKYTRDILNKVLEILEKENK